MESLDVRIIKLEPLHVASLIRFSSSPEDEAWSALLAWAQDHNLLRTTPTPRFFGFNNPSPAPGSPNYGYEVWMTVSPQVVADETVKIGDFAGGLYAVTRCTGVSHIMDTWKQFVRWQETSPYAMAQHQWLEEHLAFGGDVPPEELVLDLYMPVKA